MIIYHEYLRPKISDIAQMPPKRGKKTYFIKEYNKREVVAFIDAISLFCYRRSYIW